MFRDRLAKFFRSANANLLYIKSPLAEKVLKITFYVSTRFYKKWKSAARKSEMQIVFVDKTIAMNVDISKAMGSAFYWMGFHELNESRFLNRFLRKDMTLVDIGANQGEFSLFAAKRLSHGSVYAFEPMNIFYQQLEENIKLNNFSNIQTFHFGLSDRPAEVPIYLGESGGAGEHEGLGTIFQTQQRSRLVQNIRLEVFDEIAKQIPLNKIDFFKIDVEGAELMVLKGALNTLKKTRPVVMIEMNEDTYRSAGYSGEDIKQFFRDLNYSMNRIKKGGHLEQIKETPPFSNVIFTPNNS
jgi:FkbM family methyltransferase